MSKIYRSHAGAWERDNMVDALKRAYPPYMLTPIFFGLAQGPAPTYYAQNDCRRYSILLLGMSLK